MKIEITQWLQEAILEHAKSMACAQIIKEHGGEEIDWYASDYIETYSYGGSDPNPHYGTFKFNLARGIGSGRESHLVELELRDVVKDYVS